MTRSWARVELALHRITAVADDLPPGVRAVWLARPDVAALPVG